MAELGKLKGNGKRSPAELSSKLTLSAWKVLAAQQLEMRLKAEEQQRWLRAAVADRSRIIYKMNALLQRSLTEDNEARRRIASEGAEKKCSGPLFKTLLSELPYLYLQTDKMFRGLGFHSSVLVAYEVRRERSGQVEYFEYVDEMVLPFDFERSSQVISTLIAADSGDLKDSITMKYQMVSPNDSNAYCTVHCALRRYQEDARLVFVWRAFMEGHGKFQGLHGDMSGWYLTRPASSEDATSTLWGSYSRLVPVWIGLHVPHSKQTEDHFSRTIALRGNEMSRGLMQAALAMLRSTQLT